MMKRAAFAAVLCAGLLLLSGCGKTEPPAPHLQTGYLDTAGLQGGEAVTSDQTSELYSMADETAEPPVATVYRYTDSAGGQYTFDKAGRLCSYQRAESNPSQPDSTPKDKSALHSVCEEVLMSYLPDYAEFTSITDGLADDGASYNIALEHTIAEGIREFALVRVDQGGGLMDLAFIYADVDGDCPDKNFVTDADKAYFAKQFQPYETALDGHSAEVTFLQYKHMNGRLYAFCELTYTDDSTGMESGTKRLIFVK